MILRAKRGGEYLVPQLLVLIVLLARPLPLHGHHRLARTQPNQAVEEGSGARVPPRHTDWLVRGSPPNPILVAERAPGRFRRVHGGTGFSVCPVTRAKAPPIPGDSVIIGRCSASEELPSYITKRGLREGESLASYLFSRWVIIFEKVRRSEFFS